MRAFLFCIFTVVSSMRALAAEETICIDVYRDGFGENLNRQVKNSNFDSMNREHWGSTGNDVSNFHNKSNKRILGMEFTTLHGWTFSQLSSGNSMFSEVWMNRAQTDIIFRSAQHPVEVGNTTQRKSYFFMKATPKTPDNAYNQFDALMYDYDPPIPQSGDWFKLTPVACPPEEKVGSLCCTSTKACCRTKMSRHRCRHARCR